ncbi:MAG TPA: hypothetical protein VHU83_06730 [Bryobacteraceae bacterium]|jgi:hypothetical protein|nr:hypothetical protein [Bryobacteraceae bacterium]
MHSNHEYAFQFAGKTFTPNGQVEVPDVEAHNRAIEEQEIAALKEHPERVFLYVKPYSHLQPFERGTADVTTWLGTVLTSGASLGPRVSNGRLHSYRRAVGCMLFDCEYVGWHYESAGNYCRLRRAKVKPICAECREPIGRRRFVTADDGAVFHSTCWNTK